MKSILMFTASLCLMGLSAPAFGQSVGYDSAQYGQSIEARIGLMVPFGGDYKKTETKPQLAFNLRSEPPRNSPRDWALRPFAEEGDVREFKLAVTFEREPNLLLNNQVLSFGDVRQAPDDRLNALDTYDKTILGVIGVSLVVIAGSIIVFAE